MCENQEEPENKNPDESYYINGKNYWSKVEPTVDGMLGGFSEIDYIGCYHIIHTIMNLY